MNWFYASNNTQQGPVSDSDLKALLQSGTINATTQIWKEGMPDWKPLSEVRPDLISLPGGLLADHAAKTTSVQAMREGALPSLYAGPLNYAGFWIRFAAKFIDGIILWIVQFIIQFIFGMIIGLGFSNSSPDEAGPAVIAMALLMFLISIAIQAAYNGIMVGKFGATVGKMACGLKVVMPDGSPVSMPRAFGRYFAEILNAFTLLIGYIIAAFDNEKRALHDHIASTRVIFSR